MNLRSFLAAAVLALHGCASTTPPTLRGPEVVPIEASGEFVHDASGYVFPPEIEQFRRMSIFRAATDARRLTVGYSGGPPQCLAAITIFVSPASGSIEEAFERAKEEVRHGFPDAVLEREATHPRITSRFGEYLIGERRMHLIVEEMRPGWHLKYRVIFPAQCLEMPIYIGGFFNAWNFRQSAAH